jgi:hypothetical protein
MCAHDSLWAWDGTAHLLSSFGRVDLVLTTSRGHARWAMSSDPEVCRDYLKGVCFRGNCRYAHTTPDGASASQVISPAFPIRGVGSALVHERWSGAHGCPSVRLVRRTARSHGSHRHSSAREHRRGTQRWQRRVACECWYTLTAWVFTRGFSRSQHRTDLLTRPHRCCGRHRMPQSLSATAGPPWRCGYCVCVGGMRQRRSAAVLLLEGAGGVGWLHGSRAIRRPQSHPFDLELRSPACAIKANKAYMGAHGRQLHAFHGCCFVCIQSPPSMRSS